MPLVRVTGGAGSMGPLVTRRLLNDGHSARVFDLASADYSGLDGLADLEIAHGDLTSSADIRGAVAGVDAIAHLAAILPPVSEQNPELTQRVNVDGTRVLLEAAARVSPSCRLVLSSSVSVYGAQIPIGDVIDADQPLSPDDIYAKSKAESERLVVESSLSWVALRISGVAVPVFQEPPAVWPFLADQQIEFVHRDDAVSALVAAVTRMDVERRVFNVAGGQTWRMSGEKYVGDYYRLVEIDSTEAVYQDTPGHFALYETDDVQALLGYQNTSYPEYLQQVRQDIDRLMVE